MSWRLGSFVVRAVANRWGCWRPQFCMLQRHAKACSATPRHATTAALPTFPSQRPLLCRCSLLLCKCPMQEEGLAGAHARAYVSSAGGSGCRLVQCGRLRSSHDLWPCGRGALCNGRCAGVVLPGALLRVPAAACPLTVLLVLCLSASLPLRDGQDAACRRCRASSAGLLMLLPPPTLLLLQTRLQTAAQQCLPLQPMALPALLTRAAVPHTQHAAAAVASPHVAAAAAVASQHVVAVVVALQRASGCTQMPASRQLQRRRTCMRCWRAWPGARQSCCSGWSFRSSNGC